MAIKFEVNDVKFAEVSVDERMQNEIQNGKQVVRKTFDDEFARAKEVIDVNQGGPYGSEVLKSVEKAADSCWHDKFVMNESFKNWHKAVVKITAYENQPWTAHAIRPDGTAGTVFTFEDLRGE